MVRRCERAKGRWGEWAIVRVGDGASGRWGEWAMMRMGDGAIGRGDFIMKLVIRNGNN